MTPRVIIRLAIVALLLGLSSQTAWSQIYYQPSPYLPGFPYPGFGGGYYGYGNPYQQGYGGYQPYTNMSGYSSPSYYYSDYYSGTVTIPGWGVSGDGVAVGSARARSTMSPAVAVASKSPLLAVGYESLEPSAQVEVTVPSAAAQVWVEGALTGQQGTVRRFRTPGLNSGKEYVYNIVAQWCDGGGQTHTISRSVTLRAGTVVAVDLTK